MSFCDSNTPCHSYPSSDKEAKFSGFAAYKAAHDVQLKPWSYHPRPLGENDVEIKIDFCGICFSDIHTVTGGWGGGHNFPVIPGHEIVGHVTAAGPAVKRFKVGDRVGVGAQCCSCLKPDCKQCSSGKEQCCTGNVWTYGSEYPDGATSQGGYATGVRVHEHFAFAIPEKMKSEVAAPLLCAGATVYNPLRRYNIGKGSRVGVIGIGGLGHLAVQMASKMGATVTAISSSASKKEDAGKLGAHHYIDSSDKAAMKAAFRGFDFLLMTANFGTAQHMAEYMSLCDVNATLCTVAIPEEPFQVPPFSLLMSEVNFAASAIGSHKDIVDMLQFCADNNIEPWIETAPLTKCNEAVQKVRENKARFRIVLDTAQ